LFSIVPCILTIRLIFRDACRVTKGALYLEDKVAKDIMKPISEVKMLNMNARMDIGRWATVMGWGYSRIPIYTVIENYQGADSPYQDWPIKIWGFLYSFVRLISLPGISRFNLTLLIVIFRI
jgi:hypothetical protein